MRGHENEDATVMYSSPRVSTFALPDSPPLTQDRNRFQKLPIQLPQTPANRRVPQHQHTISSPIPLGLHHVGMQPSPLIRHLSRRSSPNPLGISDSDNEADPFHEKSPRELAEAELDDIAEDSKEVLMERLGDLMRHLQCAGTRVAVMDELHARVDEMEGLLLGKRISPARPRSGRTSADLEAEAEERSGSVTDWLLVETLDGGVVEDEAEVREEAGDEPTAEMIPLPADGPDEWREEAQESVDELVEELREVLRLEVREEVKQEWEDLQGELRHVLREELQEEVRDGLRKELKEELREEHRQELREELRDELRQELREELLEEHREELRPAFRKELRGELEEELLEEHRQELRPYFREELRGELIDELRVKLKNELRAELHEELRQNIRDELREELKDEHRQELRPIFKEELRGELKDELRGEFEAELRPILKEEFRPELSNDRATEPSHSGLFVNCPASAAAQLALDLIAAAGFPLCHDKLPPAIFDRERADRGQMESTDKRSILA